MTRETLCFNSGWLFHKGGELPHELLAYGNHSLASDETRVWQKAGNHGPSKPGNPHVDSWRKLDLPHDFVLEGAFTPESSPNNGSLPHGKAWYVKKFELPAADLGKNVRIEFDGVYRDCQVWLNGSFAGRHLSGYTSFSFDITELCLFGKLNAVAVFVDATENELWSYEGGGIYRSVRLVKSSRQHLPQWGLAISAGGENAPGACRVEVSIDNKDYAQREFEVACALLDSEGREVAAAKAAASVPAFGRASVPFEFEVVNPKLWSLESPELYKARATLSAAGREIDSVEEPFGFRFFRFDPDYGFFLNGESLKLKGVCCHQDHACVGVAVPPALQEWRVRRLKDMGCNAIRTSHNPPDPALLDACDRLGMLVMDEHRLSGVGEELLGQLESLIRRDRNHPSVILWSVGNEEMGVQKTDSGVEIFRRMQHIVHRLDPGRPVTYAMNCDWPEIRDFQAERGFHFDVFGANYLPSPQAYDDSHAKHPAQPMLGSETWGGGATRGLYEPEKSNIPIETSAIIAHTKEPWGDMPQLPFASAYGNWHTPWGYTIEECWRDCAERPFLAGTFLWTGFDYRGEPAPYHWPSVLSRFGLLDHCGFYKEVAHYLRAWWRPDAPHVFLMPHWNWEGREGELIEVRCYANCQEVELSLNGARLDRKPMPVNGRLAWQIPYLSGELLAVGYDARGSETARCSRRTAKAPHAVALSCDRVERQGSDTLLVVNASILDKDGVECPRADNTVEFVFGEDVKLLGVGNGNPLSHESDQGSNRRMAYHGLCQAIFTQKEAMAGRSSVRAESTGLIAASLTV